MVTWVVTPNAQCLVSLHCVVNEWRMWRRHRDDKGVRNSVSIHREITRVIVFPDTRRMTTGKPAAVTFIHVGLLLLCLYIHTDRALTGAVIAFYIVSHADAFYILNCRLITRRFRFASSHISTLITWKHDTLNVKRDFCCYRSLAYAYALYAFLFYIAVILQ